MAVRDPRPGQITMLWWGVPVLMLALTSAYFVLDGRWSAWSPSPEQMSQCVSEADPPVGSMGPVLVRQPSDSCREALTSEYREPRRRAAAVVFVTLCGALIVIWGWFGSRPT
jgi:predicted nucleic acid-binding Zn ribbon protein